ncbi:hypothetical protein [uncultured Kordia sp.]|uniref:hypothetical protein n=1 Tax=uncultured Kordia sp. TaxID=507699 RepID=UPI0026388776|nr:hypothetical protein [uncultured Kordia sp.]
MFTPFSRVLLIILSIVFSFYLYTKGEYVSVGITLFSSLLFIYGYYRYGTVYIAFNEIKKGRFDKAEKLISTIKNPAHLSKSHKSYYHYTLGYIFSNKQEWEKSYSEFNKALEIGLRTKNDTSIVLLNLANTSFEQKKIKEAKEFIAKTRTYNLKPMIASEVAKLEKEINAVAP